MVTDQASTPHCHGISPLQPPPGEGPSLTTLSEITARENARRAAVLFLGGCPGGRAATSAYLGILCRVAKGGARSRPSAAVPRLLLVAGTRSYVDCRWHPFRHGGDARAGPWGIPYVAPLQGFSPGGRYGTPFARTGFSAPHLPHRVLLRDR